MSDLEDLDHEPEPAHVEEEHAGEELSAHQMDELGAELDDTGSFEPPKSNASGALIKIAVVAVVLVGGGAYFVMSSHHGAKAPAKMAAESTLSSTYKMPPSKSVNAVEPSKNTKPAAAAAPSAWSGAAAPVPYPPPVAPAPAAALPMAPAPSPVPLAAAIPAPAAIPTIPGAPSAIPSTIPGASGQQPAPFGAPSPMPSSAPPIVNDMPPPMGLTNTSDGMPPAAATTPFATAGSAMPDMPSPIPSAAPSAAPAQAQANTPKTLSPLMPDAIPAPVQKQAAQPTPKGWPPQIKNGQPMPSAVVAPVDKMEISKAPAVPAMPAPEPAKVQALEKEVADLKKTISQLQQASVMKEDTVGKSVEKMAEGENAEEPAPSPQKAHHHASHHKTRHVAAAHHATASKWVLKAAKPGVAWVAKKGSSDITMVEPGDSLAGIGRVTSITRSSSGYWVVSGTKGRISQ